MVTLLDIDAVDAPTVALIDASDEGLDEAALRARARELGMAVGAGEVSRSYCHPYALVAWYDGPIGVDVERVVQCDDIFAQSICTPVEYAADTRPRTDEEMISMWSSKEALAKGLGDAVLYDPRRLASPIGWRDGAAGAWRAVSPRVTDGYCAWICWRSGRSRATRSRRDIATRG